MKKTLSPRRIGMMLLCIALMLLAAYTQSRRNDKTPVQAATESAAPADTAVMQMSENGAVVVRTRTLAADVKGYAGTVPLEITLRDGVIDSVACLENNETPMFFHNAESLLENYIGKTPAEAAAMKVDAVSGATYSSRALTENVRRGMEYAAGHEVTSGDGMPIDLSPKTVCGIIVALLGALLPLFVHSRRLRIVQQLLNVGVLGLWCGTFLSYSLMLGYLEGGIQWGYAVIPVIMLVAAFVFPLFGHRNHYCNHLCPYGSLQELASRIPVRKIQLGHTALKRLEWARIGLWCVLMFLLISGLWTAWLDMELFSAFVFKAASVGIIVAAAAFVVLSVFVPRPYCRFVCPTGSLLKFF